MDVLYKTQDLVSVCWHHVRPMTCAFLLQWDGRFLHYSWFALLMLFIPAFWLITLQWFSLLLEICPCEDHDCTSSIHFKVFVPAASVIRGGQKNSSPASEIIYHSNSPSFIPILAECIRVVGIKTCRLTIKHTEYEIYIV